MTGIWERDRLRRIGNRLEWATIAWNVGEAVLTITLGVLAGSLGLVGFGLDSMIELFASGVVVWHTNRPDHPEVVQITRRAHRMIAGAFGLLAAFLLALAIERIASGRVAEESPLGIAYLAVTAVVMFSLAAAKRRVGDRLGSTPLRSEAAMTFLDGMLATGVLVSLVVTAVWQWPWADPLAAVLVAVLALREAKENLERSRE